MYIVNVDFGTWTPEFVVNVVSPAAAVTTVLKVCKKQKPMFTEFMEIRIRPIQEA